MIKGLIGAAIGGVVGASIWAAVGYFTGYEVGWIAWGIGAMVGFGMAIGVRDDGDMTSGGIAAVVAIASIVAGKYLVAHLLVTKEMKQLEAEMQPITIDEAKVYMADQLVKEYESAGKPVAWPEGMSVEEATEPADYPPDLWKDLEARWKTMDQPAQEQYRAGLEVQRKADFESFRTSITSSAFKDSFSLWDGLWFVLAVMTAYKVGSGGGSDEE